MNPSATVKKKRTRSSARRRSKKQKIIQNRISKDEDEDGWFVSPGRERAEKKQQLAVPVTDIKADPSSPSPQEVKAEQSPLPLGDEATSVEDLSQKIQQLHAKKHEKEILSKIFKDLESSLESTPATADALVANGIVPALLCHLEHDDDRRPEISASALRLLEMILQKTSSPTSGYKLILEGEKLDDIIYLMTENLENSTIVEFGLKITNALIFAHRRGWLRFRQDNASLERNNYVHYGYACTRCKVSPIIGVRYKNTRYDKKIDINACQRCFRSHYHPKFQNDMHFRKIQGEFVSGLEKFTRDALWKRLSDAFGDCEAGILYIFDAWDEHGLEIQNQLVILAGYIQKYDKKDILGVRKEMNEIVMPRLKKMKTVEKSSPFYQRAMNP